MVIASLVCIATLLFPAISLTDDLHVEYLATDAPAKRISQLLSTHHQKGTVVIFAVLLLLITALSFSASALWGTASSERSSLPLDGFLVSLIARAPPDFAL
ncbi:MAG TPA: hypothetical protein VK473_04580 [Terriglobales bacterium]|nr:hypothetical protein [Terriglobales bacterium]